VMSYRAGFAYFVLAVLTVLLLTQALVQATRLTAAGGLPMMAILCAALFQCAREWMRRVRHKAPHPLDRLAAARMGLAVFTGAMTTYILAYSAGLGPVVAAALVGALAALVAPSAAAATFCGAFVGMVSRDCLYSLSHVALAAALAAALFVMAAPVFNGFGGKLGTIAFSGCVLAAWLTGNPLLQAPLPDGRTAWLIVLFSMAAAVATFSLGVRLKLGPVLASSLVGLAGGLLLPRVWPQSGPLLAVVVFCASFAGMSSPERLRDERHLLLAGLLVGLIYVFATPIMGGAGGKLGTIAFGATLAARSFSSAVAHGRNRLAASRGDGA
jgi:hypothetical protein